MTARRICLVPKLAGVGGMVSFQHKLAHGLAVRGVEVCYHLEDKPYQAVLVIGGVRDLAGLRGARRNGARVVQRLDGMNWLHRRRNTGIRHFLRAEYGNWILRLIRDRLAQAIVYQSEFARGWWERTHGKSGSNNEVVYNGVDLSLYSPGGAHQRPLDRFRLLLVEGSLGGGYEMGLETAVRLVDTLDQKPAWRGKIELEVVGKISDRLRQDWLQRGDGRVSFTGLVPVDQIPYLDRSAHLLYSADLNAACPNAVIEALACGLPVLAFDTGALPELVTGQAGRVVPYGADVWKLEPPDIQALAEAAQDILTNQEHFRRSARKRAEEAFSLDIMVDGYLRVLLP